MKDTLPEDIMKAIDERGITPRPRWHFLLKGSVFWSMATATVVLGSMAIDVIIFVVFDHDTEARAYLNQSLVEDILLTIPYIWLASFGLLIVLTRLIVRHMKQGYRYGITQVVCVSLAASMALGIAMNALDVGESVNEFLNESIPYYNSLVYTSKNEWSQPTRGLLGGTVLSDATSSEIRIQDFHHAEWRVDISGVEQSDGFVQPKQGDVIKMVGKDTGNNTFQTEQLFPWQK